MEFSIITPCFNSSRTLERVYSSLLNLTAGVFEWILVDDCSTDEGKTQLLMKSIAASSPFPVKLIFLDKNHFGSRSTYEACLIASGDFACILDHDDQLVPDSLSIVSKYLETLDNKNIAGVAGRCVNLRGELIGRESREKVFVGKEGELRFKRRMTFETLQFTKLEILKSYFSRFRPGYTNGFAWAEMSLKYDFIFVSDILRVYDVDLPTSYSNTKRLHVRHPLAKAEATQRALECYSSYLFWNPAYSIRIAASSIRHRLNGGMNVFIDLPRKCSSRFFYFLAMPAGYLKYLIDR